MKKLEKIYLVLFVICVIGAIIATHNGSPFLDSLYLFVPLVVTYPIAWLIRYAVENNKNKAKRNINAEIQNTYEQYNNLNKQTEHQINWPMLIIGIVILIGGIILVINSSYIFTKY